MEQPQVLPAQTVRIIPQEQMQSPAEVVTVFQEPPVLPEPPQMEEPKPGPQVELTQNGINIGLSAQVRQKVATMLNKLLSDEYVLYTKTLKYHWNVQGIVFHDFHAMFKEQYEALFDIVDLVAERARALGAPALGSLQDFSANTRLKEINGHMLTPVQMVSNLLADHEAIIRTIRVEITSTAELDDQGTSNLLQDLILKHEKFAWMLRATLQK
jgi:starvation-inducible DNA-binding protein